MRGRVVIRGKTDRLQRSLAFGISASLHGCVLVWLVMAAVLQPARPRSVYDQEIKPHVEKLVWYNLRERLPDVRPSETATDKRPPRARRRFHQQLVAGRKDSERAPQMIWMPAPRIELAKALPLPNVLAVAPARPHREFTPPPEKARPVLPQPLLPEAPRLSTEGKVQPFELHASMPHPAARAFTPPPVRAAAPPRPVTLEAAPQVALAMETKNVALDAAAPRPQRAFSAPAETPKPAPEPVRLDAPTAPEDAGAPAYSTASLAIVGLNPAHTTVVPPPPGAHDAGFSGGPQTRAEGGTGAGMNGGLLVVPGLLATGGAKDAQPTLQAALAAPDFSRLPGNLPPRPAHIPPSGEQRETAVRVANSPDPSWQGRAVYTVAIEIPNVTSYTGSWIVWFAEHHPLPGMAPVSMKAPLPLHMVDPKYIVSAVEERIEGAVRLSAVIRKDGRVESIALLQHLDARLDRSAEEALAQWTFAPAERDGVPIDIDAVFEIPFHLAPRPKR